MADLIRLHHDATSRLASILFLDDPMESRAYDGRSYDPAINEEETSMRDAGADALMIRSVGKQSKRIQI